ncbi:MAG: hypothetical protein ABI843_16800 [Dokdonella sp.]
MPFRHLPFSSACTQAATGVALTPLPAFTRGTFTNFIGCAFVLMAGIRAIVLQGASSPQQVHA